MLHTLGIEPPKIAGVSYYKSERSGTKKCANQKTGKKDPCNIIIRDFEGGRKETTRIYSKGRMNSKPKRRISPEDSWRSTLATMGGVSLGTMLEVAGPGVGMVR